MILATHAITGAAVASVVPSHPIIGFTLGFASHFLLDSLPHWQYKLSSALLDEKNSMNDDIQINKNFAYDLVKICLDVMIGFLAIFLLFDISHSLIFIISICAGAVGAMLPDALQFLYYKWRKEPLVSLQKFHIWIHTKTHLYDRPAIGIASQLTIIILAIFLQRFLMTS